VSTQTVRNIEIGSVWWPNEATIRSLANAFNVQPDILTTEWEKDTADLHVKLAKLGQQPLGARWIPADDHFVIDPWGSDSDVRATRDTVVRQLHTAVIQKAQSLSDVSKRLDNALGWHGVSGAAERFLDSVQRPLEEIPAHLGTIYSAILELGSFLEQDEGVHKNKDDFGVEPLAPDVHRVFADLISTAAPWLRRFPTIRALDDETSAFVTRDELVEPGSILIKRADEKALVSPGDAAAVSGLVAAARRGSQIGQKAKTRGIGSVRNLIIFSATFVATFLINATASDYAAKSPLIHRAGSFLVQSEAEVEKLVSNLPADIRLALRQLIKDIKEHLPRSTDD
jgi:hypothetical protein